MWRIGQLVYDRLYGLGRIESVRRGQQRLVVRFENDRNYPSIVWACDVELMAKR